MQSARIDIFFSCSFDDNDKEINAFFKSICNALDIKCINVETAYAQVPPAVARKQINECQALIAIATKREKSITDKFSMPPSVNDEISMAYGMKTPVLLFVEKEVILDGMTQNYGTHSYFDRDKIADSDSLKNIIRAIHNLKMDIVSPHDLIYEHDTTEFIADYYKHLVELKEEGDDFIWSYSTTKKIIFLKPFKKTFPLAFWASIPSKLPENPQKIKWECIVENSSKKLELKIEIVEHTANCLKALIKVDPHPNPDDYIEYSTFARSRYFNPVYDDEVDSKSFLRIGDRTYKSYDGFIPIQRTKKAVLEFRFPRKYPIKSDDITFFVGSYTDEVDYVIESEIKRANITKESVGGNLTIRIDIESPLLRHMYGIAWNPIKRA